MLVYGDPQFQTRRNAFVGRVRERISATAPDELDELRTALVQAGQLEQGLADAQCEPTELQLAQRVTDLLAAALVSSWCGGNGESPQPEVSVSGRLAEASEGLESLLGRADCALSIKVPEGFQFYCLFPEQYCASALRWAAEREGAQPRKAVVVGIRSIGTGLSAVVKAALERVGWAAERCTVRPTGHPFARQVQLDIPSKARHAIVVDEGPGISGSSMAAVALALSSDGVEDIALFPGHGGEPGAAATDGVRRCWAETPRYITPLDDLRWGGRCLTELLLAKSTELPRQCRTGERSPVNGNGGEVILDVGGGLWRKVAFEQEAGWPAVAANLERMKFLCRLDAQTSVLWKFTGLGCAEPDCSETSPVVTRTITERGAGVEGWPKLASFRGFAAMPWVRGRHLCRDDATQGSIVRGLAELIISAAGPPMAEAEAKAATERLVEMVYWNTGELLGEAAAQRAQQWSKALRQAEPEPSYGDGRMGPWEFVLTPEGDLVKTDCGGHDLDHTLVGRQSLLWDVAGVMVEWGLGRSQYELVLERLRGAGVPVDPARLRFYELAYAAFRAGVMSLASSHSGVEEAELKRLAEAQDYYQEQLGMLLGVRVPG